MKWDHPIFEISEPFCYIKAGRTSIDFGFWRGAELSDPEGLLFGSGKKTRHMNLTCVQEIEEGPLRALIAAASALA